MAGRMSDAEEKLRLLLVKAEGKHKLSRDEDSWLASVSHGSDPRLASLAREVFVTSCIDLAYKVAHKEHSKHLELHKSLIIDIDDVISAAFLGLTEASRKYQAGSKASFATYAWYWIRLRVQRMWKKEYYLRPSKKGTTKISVVPASMLADKSPVALDAAEARVVEDNGPETEARSAETRAILEDLISELPEKQQLALSERYAGRVTSKGLQKHFSWSRGEQERACRSALKYLKIRLIQKGLDLDDLI